MHIQLTRFLYYRVSFFILKIYIKQVLIMSQLLLFDHYFFELVKKTTDFHDLNNTFFKSEWEEYGLANGFDIYNVYNKNLELVGMVGMEEIETIRNGNIYWQLHLQLLEVIPKYRGNDIGLVIIAFCLDQYYTLRPAYFNGPLLINSKVSSREYYKKIGATELPFYNDVFFFGEEEGKELVNHYK